MKVDFSSLYTEKYLLPFRLLYTKSSFVQKGAFFIFVFSLSVFFFVSRSEAENRAYEGGLSIQPVSTKDQNESCYWQEDVTQFLSLQSHKKNMLEVTIPCEMKILDITSLTSEKSVKVYDNELEKQISTLTDGYPILDMTKTIATYDREIAGLIVGIAKKESDWGKRVPVDGAGKDCFNYWGYKGAGTRGVEMGHGCFGSGEEAVQAVGNRLKQLVEKKQTSEPKNMIIWKCGSSCAGHSDESVRKWISDVAFYYNQIVPQSITYLDK